MYLHKTVILQFNGILLCYFEVGILTIIAAHKKFEYSLSKPNTCSYYFCIQIQLDVGYFIATLVKVLDHMVDE